MARALGSEAPEEEIVVAGGSFSWRWPRCRARTPSAKQVALG